MAVAPICFKMCYKNGTINNDQEVIGGKKNTNLCYNSVATSIKQNKSMLKYANYSRYISPNASEKPSRLSSGSSSREKQLRSLDTYFKKSNNDITYKEIHTSKKVQVPLPFIIPTKKQAKLGDGAGLKSNSDETETSGLYIISTMASINIAVYLFEIASPIKNSDLEIFSLPALYGAKINHLILYGEWWRLLTPMFLHTGILHIGLGCWALLTFGPQVCRAYGPFTFFLIYILGGLSGNFTSFLHSPNPTVGGTGPVFAIIGAWLIYQYQNKDAIRKEVFESMYQKAIFATALGFVLSTYGPIDDWTHFGSVFTGIAYGFMTCPTLVQIDDSSDSGKDNGITLISRNVNPYKSLVTFSIFVVVLSCLLLVFEPPLGSLDVDTLV